MMKTTHPQHCPCEEQRDVAIQMPLTKKAFALNPLVRHATLAMTTALDRCATARFGRGFQQ
jgi:hypothetical protein